MTEPMTSGRLAICALAIHPVTDNSGNLIGYVAETRLGYLPCNLADEAIAGHQETFDLAAFIVRSELA